MGDEKKTNRLVDAAKNAVSETTQAATVAAGAAMGAGMTPGQAILTGIVSAGVGSILGDVMNGNLLPDQGTRRLADAVNAEAWTGFSEEEAATIRERVEALEKAGRKDAFTTFAAHFKAYAEARVRSSNDKKARLLAAAFADSFREDLFDQGLSVRVLETLGELDYPEIRFLKHGYDGDRLAYYAESLRYAKAPGLPEGVATTETREYLQEGSEPFELVSRLAEHRLVTMSASVHDQWMTRRTWWGEAVLKYIENGNLEQDPEPKGEDPCTNTVPTGGSKEGENSEE